MTEAVARSIITGITVRDVAEWEKELHRIAEANQFVLPARIRRKHAHSSMAPPAAVGQHWRRPRAAAKARVRSASVIPWDMEQARPSQSAGQLRTENIQVTSKDFER